MYTVNVAGITLHLWAPPMDHMWGNKNLLHLMRHQQLPGASPTSPSISLSQMPLVWEVPQCVVMGTCMGNIATQIPSSFIYI